MFLKRFLFFGSVFAAMLAALGATATAFQQPQPPTPTLIPPPPSSTVAPAVIEPMPGGVVTNPQWMSIDHHRVNIDVDNQIAATTVDMQFTNNGDGMVEGTFLFPLPPEAAVDNLTMYVNGQPIEAKILRAEEAREIYNEIVRQYRDPALLEYVGTNAIQASVFPIPPGESRRIEIGYTQLLEAENGLLRITYPMETPATNNRMVNSANITVTVSDDDAIRNIYSPTHNVALNRDGETAFTAGFEASNYTPDGDFVLYYGVENARVSMNLLTFRESQDESGFFMMLVQPPITPSDDVVPKDVVLVIDQSGSMSGVKWEQAQDAADFVLDRLNPNDRFNAVVFSTGWQLFSEDMEPASQASAASNWIYSIQSGGGTDINSALQQALSLTNSDRPTTILFLTDGLAENGITDTNQILANVQNAAQPNVRIFTFGVGADVNTVLLDRLSGDFRGASSYVLPGESIETEVSSLYSKISAPVLTDVEMEIDGVRTDFIYPFGQLPDLFAGQQLTVVGRYRSGAEGVTMTLSGQVNGEPTTYTYENLTFRERTGGEAFIARLWATRRIGDLLTQIRLNGESEELVNSVVDLSLRYGIITPYTSFLIEEDDILSQQARERAAAQFQPTAQAMAANESGGQAVQDADNAQRQSSVDNLLALTSTPLASNAFGGGSGGGMSATPEPTQSFNGVAPGAPAAEVGDVAMDDAEAEEGFAAPPTATPQRVLNVARKTFVLQNGVYTDTLFNPDEMETEQVVFFSDEYFALLEEIPELADYFAIGEAVIVVIDGTAYEVVPE